MEFAVIKWKDRQLYIKEGDTDTTFNWTDNLQEAIWFPTCVDAEKTASNYFVMFENWETRDVIMDDNSLIGYLVSNKELEPGTYEATAAIVYIDDEPKKILILEGEVLI